MVKIPKEMIVERIKQSTGLSDDEINAKIKKKLDQLSGLISEEGAAHIVANELGVKVLEETGGDLKVKNVLPGMKSVNLVGKVIRKYETRTFQTDTRSGKVGSFLLGDDTGVIRVVAWNDKADLLDTLKEESVIKIEAGYARENNRGGKELHLGDRSKISASDETVEVKEKSRNRKKIAELKENQEDVEILGTIVSVFDPRFFEICPECGKRARQGEGGFTCETHGVVEPNFSYVMNLLLDDGSSDVRAVLWRTQVQHLLDKPHEEIVMMKDGSFESIKTDLLGKIIKLVGRTSMNSMFDRVEFIAQLVFTDPDPEAELKRMKEDKKSAEPVEKEEGEKKTPVASEKSKSPEPSTEKKSSDDDIEVLSLEDLESL